MSALPFLLLALSACQGSSSNEKPAPVRDAIELRDAKGNVDARLTAGRPCRATIEADEMIVGGSPLVMMLGDVRWSGEDIDGSTVIARDGTTYARIYPALPSETEVALFDLEGVALIRIDVTGDVATVRDSAQTILRELRRTGAAITIPLPGGNATVTGTTDLLLASLLSATEVSPEMRALAACHRLLPSQKAAI